MGDVGALPNQRVVDESLASLLKLHKKEIFLDFNCHAIGKIETFQSDAQTASVSFVYSKTFLRSPGPNSLGVTPEYIDYPVLAMCPVVILSGGPAYLNMPIKAGDECIILFNDRDIDNWFQSGQKSPLSSSRMHSFSDGLILVGPRSLKKSITNYDAVRALLTDGSVAIGVNPSNSKVLISNTYPANAVTLNTILQNLITHLQTLIAQTAAITVTAVTPGPPASVSGPPVNAAAITAVSTQLAADALQLQGLLE